MKLSMQRDLKKELWMFYPALLLWNNALSLSGNILKELFDLSRQHHRTKLKTIDSKDFLI